MEFNLVCNDEKISLIVHSEFFSLKTSQGCLSFKQIKILPLVYVVTYLQKPVKILYTVEKDGEEGWSIYYHPPRTHRRLVSQKVMDFNQVIGILLQHLERYDNE